MKCQAPNPSISEAQLVRLVREGHIAAFAELFELHKSSIYALCLGSTDVVAEAEELLHAIFLDAFRTVTSSPVYSGFAKVLYSAADNRIQMHERNVYLAAPFLDHLVELAGHPVAAPKTAPRFCWVRERMRSARAILSSQHA